MPTPTELLGFVLGMLGLVVFGLCALMWVSSLYNQVDIYEEDLD